jgi:hypothetical protein
LPRFWYFPRGKKAVVVMTGDDHANGGTAGRFNQEIAASPAGCNVANWECIRSTSYIFVEPDNLSNAQAANFTAQGFEVALHINTACGDFTPTSLNQTYDAQLSDFASSYTSIPLLAPMRHHCIVWSDWATAAKIQLQKGIRFDTSYYFWPPGWAQNRPGHFTGSAMPMRFADTDGSLIDVYNAPSQMTDESGQTYPFTSDALLSAAVGPQGYYGVYTVNAHTDSADNPVATGVLSSALSRNIPVVSSIQMLTWLDGRNSSSFSGLTWSGNVLTFTISAGSGANGLQAMIPTHSAGALLASMTGPAGAVSYSFDTIKGVEYAFFSAHRVPTRQPMPAIRLRQQCSPQRPRMVRLMWRSHRQLRRRLVKQWLLAQLMPQHSCCGIPRMRWYLRQSAMRQQRTSLPDAERCPVVVDDVHRNTQPNHHGSNRQPPGIELYLDVRYWCGSLLPMRRLWYGTPTNPSVNDPNAVEVGVKFRVDLDGFISGIRFYKGTTNTGTHVGSLWSSSGQPLGSLRL